MQLTFARISQVGMMWMCLAGAGLRPIIVWKLLPCWEQQTLLLALSAAHSSGESARYWLSWDVVTDRFQTPIPF